MITPETSEQEVPRSVVPGVPGGTPGHTPNSASQVGIARPKKQGPDAPGLGPYAPKDGFNRFQIYDRGQTICAPERRKASDEIRQLPSLIILFVVPMSTAI
jgi:hypothetical protein